jgi:hypothetical protein
MAGRPVQRAIKVRRTSRCATSVHGQAYDPLVIGKYPPGFSIYWMFNVWKFGAYAIPLQPAAVAIRLTPAKEPHWSNER